VNWKNLAPLLADVAPLIGTAIGGPAGGAVGALVANTLGVKNNPQAIAQAIKQNPDALVKIKQLESDERQQFRQLALETTRLELQNQQHAREQHKDHWMPATITLVLAIMVCAMFGIIVFSTIPPGKENLLYMLVGQVLTAFLTSVAFWIGTSRSSAEKTKLMQAGS
jgi:gas vesicle protein